MKTSFLLLTICVFGLHSNVYGWGKTGHRTVGEIASRNLSPKAKEAVKKIFNNKETLAEAALWPDRIKSEAKYRKLYSHLHYISFDKNISLDDHLKKSQEHILWAIDKFTKDLKDKKSTNEQKLIALRFLAHLIGDLHQPLHVGYSNDRGGNTVKATWFGNKTDLHHIWDDDIIKLEELSYTEYASKLNIASQKDIMKWQKSAPTEWAKESREYLPKTYDFKEKKYWEYEYSYKHLDFLNLRLQQAGYRLAGHLNKLF